MQKLIVILMLCFLTTGCSLVKTITAPFKSVQNTLPQQIEQTKNKIVCKGEYKLDEDGNIIYCSKGYFNYQSVNNVKERRLTLKERIIQFLDKLVGWSFWIVLGLIFLCPSLLGLVLGRAVEGSIGITGKTLRGLVRGVQKTRKEGKDLNQSLEAELDTENKKYIAKIKEQEKIK